MGSGQLHHETRARSAAGEFGNIPWLRLLDRGSAKRVLAELCTVTVQAETSCVRRGDEAHHWIGVLDGLMRLCNDCPPFPVATFAGLPPGAWFGEGPLLKRSNYFYDVIAIRDTRVALLPAERFHWLLENCSDFNRYVMNQLNERLNQFIAAAQIHMIRDPDAKVARILGALFDPTLSHGDRFLKITQRELGALAGLSRQRVNQALRVLQDQRLVQVEYSGLRVVDLPKLQRSGVLNVPVGNRRRRTDGLRQAE